MKRIVFKMQLNHGKEKEYKKRHDALWAEIKALILEAGVYGYSIYFDKSTHSLFAIMDVNDHYNEDQLSRNRIMQTWWDYMADIMQTHVDNSPVTYHLEEVFNLLNSKKQS